ncbi:hypothetical protein D3C87_1345330 [compost metagenome]
MRFQERDVHGLREHTATGVGDLHAVQRDVDRFQLSPREIHGLALERQVASVGRARDHWNEQVEVPDVRGIANTQSILEA